MGACGRSGDRKAGVPVRQVPSRSGRSGGVAGRQWGCGCGRARRCEGAGALPGGAGRLALRYRVLQRGENSVRVDRRMCHARHNFLIVSS